MKSDREAYVLLSILAIAIMALLVGAIAYSASMERKRQACIASGQCVWTADEDGEPVITVRPERRLGL